MIKRTRFEAAVLPWLDAGYNLARWLLHDESAADDAVQEAALRAIRYFDAFNGGDARPWFLGIVRNTCFDVLRARSGRHELAGFDDDALGELQHAAGLSAPDLFTGLNRERERVLVNAAIRALSPPLREVIVLRELEELDYAQIAEIASIPIGTVMSRLSRAREKLRVALTEAGVGR
jgi:RNA polymerase sigma factor (sigma-70 family)